MTTEAADQPKILIVDDTKENIDVLMEVFRDDYRVVAATRPDRALKLAHADNPPDIILLDILMPEMDGYELCAALKSDEATRTIPVVFVTAVSEAMDAARGFTAGAVDYITKPFVPAVVKARINLHLDLKKKHELLEKYAFIDALTEVPNRRRFDQVLADEWNRARRSSQPLSLIAWDVDHFKLYNDTYGHGSGDTCLRRLAMTVYRSLNRSGDFVARVGGEEFMVLLPYTDRQAAREIARHLASAIEALALPHRSSPIADIVTVSMGLATYNPHHAADLTAETFLQAADRALYAAKNGGRNRVEEAP